MIVSNYSIVLLFYKYLSVTMGRNPLVCSHVDRYNNPED